MNKVRFIVCIVCLFVAQVWMDWNDNAIKVFVAEKIGYAWKYYKQQAWNYYLDVTGQLPILVHIERHPEFARIQVLSDALVLNENESKKLDSSYRNVFHATMAPLQRRGWRRYDREDWREDEDRHFQQTLVEFKQQAKEKYGEAELDIIEKVLSRPIATLDPHLRALRFVRLREEQRTLLLPYASRLVLTMDSDAPSSSRRWIRIEDRNPKEPSQAFREEKAIFLSKVKEVLSSSQMQRWQARAAEVENAIDNHYRQRRMYAPRVISNRGERRADESNAPVNF